MHADDYAPRRLPGIGQFDADPGRLMTTREVADWLGLSPETVLRRWRAGELPGYRVASNVLRFDRADIDAWLRRARGDTLADDGRRTRAR